MAATLRTLLLFPTGGTPGTEGSEGGGAKVAKEGSILDLSSVATSRLGPFTLAKSCGKKSGKISRANLLQCAGHLHVLEEICNKNPAAEHIRRHYFPLFYFRFHVNKHL